MSDEIDWDSLTFSLTPTDHMYITETQMDEAWMPGEMSPYGDMKISPAAGVLNYGQGLFEGMKAYKGPNDEAFLFRPEQNAKRLNKSAVRMCMPEIPENLFLEGLYELLRIDEKWIPNDGTSSLYIRPFMYGSSNFIKARPSNCLLYTSPSPRDATLSRMPSSA